MSSTFFVNALLLSVRLLPLMVASPILFFARIPLTIRVLLGLALAAVIASPLSTGPVPRVTVPMLAGELLLGVVMAFAFHAAHAALDLAGKLIDTQVGLNAAGVFDPGTTGMSGMVSELLTLTLAVLFVNLDLHHDLLRVFSALLAAVPPGSVSAGLLDISLTGILTRQFLLAFMLVSPVIVGLWLIDAAFAFLSRSMPQANVYFLALPVKLGMGMLLVMLALPMIVQRMPQLLEQALRFAFVPGASA
ncbi:flagellar biosynthesis protein [Pseudomonas sp. LLC-1]|uniref:flagellar biosynthetic protein FliR n=1 Tax=Pseudomonas sp. LLC-1 TaxID=1812180 RepID=UPI000D019C64|nr:flagellar biosynthetic protein FliR [Pseudomonas sp. LLC-1]PRN02991.1 flagellar biosynthesis protein [Pseudomonas sp. LLC-1]